MRTAPPTSPARSRSASRPPKCATASPACSRAISPSPARSSRKAPPARSSIRWRARRCGRPGSISITAPATASAAISRCTKVRRASPSSAPCRCRRGMILSNEPGYYKTGAYGIRIENLVLVIAEPKPAGGEKPLNAFETLTLAPIDRRLIDAEMLTTPKSAPGSTLSCARSRVDRPAGRWPTRKWLRSGDATAANSEYCGRTHPQTHAPRAPLDAYALLAAADGDDARLGRSRSTSWCRRFRIWSRRCTPIRHGAAHDFALSCSASRSPSSCSVRCPTASAAGRS